MQNCSFQLQVSLSICDLLLDTRENFEYIQEVWLWIYLADKYFVLAFTWKTYLSYVILLFKLIFILIFIFLPWICGFESAFLYKKKGN